MSMGYLSNYQAVRNRYRKYLSGRQSKKLLDLSQKYSRQNSFNRVAAASALRTGFQQGFRGLQNTGMQNSGEVERLKRRLGADFTYQNDRLKKNEVSALNEMGAKYRKQTIARRNARRNLGNAADVLLTGGAALAASLANKATQPQKVGMIKEQKVLPRMRRKEK